ncbi:hypothetical protein [uncultured Desulfovibrio sp.]|uniref:hypothetical protein n=1 Tax=uncultured Desulfovibrio sp. TaxID=167968 RepID=UPI00261609DA|nr:hypothetical protein [uncultured Desulfovibrio sp.]
MPATDIPATNEILLKTDASKQFLDALLGQGWETFGQSLGGSQAAELMLQIFAAFNLVALALLSAFFIWIMAIAVAGTAHEGVPFGKKFSSLWMPSRPYSRGFPSSRSRCWPASAGRSIWGTTSGSWAWTTLWSTADRSRCRLRIRT